MIAEVGVAKTVGVTTVTVTVSGTTVAVVAVACINGYCGGDRPLLPIVLSPIPKSRPPKCGCTCTCRAIVNDNIVGNKKAGEADSAFGTARTCSEAKKETKRIVTYNLGKQPKHIPPCQCTER